MRAWLAPNAEKIGSAHHKLALTELGDFLIFRPLADSLSGDPEEPGDLGVRAEMLFELTLGHGAKGKAHFINSQAYVLYYREKRAHTCLPFKRTGVAAMGSRTLGARLSEAMDDCRLNAAELAAKVKTSPTTIGNWKADKITPDKAKGALLLRIADALGVRSHWLLFGIEPKRTDAQEAAIPNDTAAFQSTTNAAIDELRFTLGALLDGLSETTPELDAAVLARLAEDGGQRPGFLALLTRSIEHRIAQHAAQSRRSQTAAKRAQTPGKRAS